MSYHTLSHLSPTSRTTGVDPTRLSRSIRPNSSIIINNINTCTSSRFVVVVAVRPFRRVRAAFTINGIKRANNINAAAAAAVISVFKDPPQRARVLLEADCKRSKVTEGLRLRHVLQRGRARPVHRVEGSSEPRQRRTLFPQDVYVTIY